MEDPRFNPDDAVYFDKEGTERNHKINEIIRQKEEGQQLEEAKQAEVEQQENSVKLN